MLREKIKSYLVKNLDEEYRKELAAKEDSYANWYVLHKRELDRRMAEKDHSAGEALTTEVVRYSRLRSYILSGGKKPDIIIACDDEGYLTDYAEMLVRDFFAENRGIDLVYGDEDRLDEDHVLQDPWLKADWSPDTFLSTFYFGNVFAFRSVALGMINPGERRASDIESKAAQRADSREEKEAAEGRIDDNLRSWIYGQLCLKLAQAAGGFSLRRNGRFPIGHIREILFHAQRVPEPWDSRLIRESLTGRYSSASAATRLISIIIPSKDNPEVLRRCIETIGEHSEGIPYEIIVVDNGSTPENQAKIRRLEDRINESGCMIYVVKPMEFNFSRMCNFGTRYANGELLLFLNDDIEIRRPGWLLYLSEKAKLPYVGAVGMKLLYPNSDVIQHAGVVNVRVGPIHKLQYCSNTETHYFGFNKGVRNVLAVTGACLMVRRELFDEVGGFDEDQFAVSFNDIDLCYRIFESGYYNVVRNNMYLYHHESLSRGDDRHDKVKSLRLSREQLALLKKHPDLFGTDPFYHPCLSQDPAVTKFVIGIEDQMLSDPQYAAPQLRTRPLRAEWEDQVLRLGVEFANSLGSWFRGPFAEKEEQGYYIKGYAFVINADNAVYERKLLLRRKPDDSGAAADSRVWEVPVERVYRPDIADNLTDQVNDRLTGFACVIRAGALPAGTYETGMLAIDRSSGRGRIVNWSDADLVIQ